jgi:hypothetical protein
VHLAALIAAGCIINTTHVYRGIRTMGTCLHFASSQSRVPPESCQGYFQFSWSCQLASWMCREPLFMPINHMRFPGPPASSQACRSVELSHHDWPLAEMCCPVAPSYTIVPLSHGNGRVRALGSVGAVETRAHASLWPEEGQADGSLPIFSLPLIVWSANYNLQRPVYTPNTPIQCQKAALQPTQGHDHRM